MYGIIQSFLCDRKYRTSDGIDHDYNKGVPQGSSLGPILWLLVAEEVLRMEYTEDVYIQAFADVVVLIGVTACYRLTEQSKNPARNIGEWVDRYGGWN